jgi:hypothetical protein
VDTVEGPRKNLAQPAGASARYANPAASTWLVAFCFPLSSSSCELTPSTLTAANLCWPRQPSPHGQKANRDQDHRLTTGPGSALWLRKWHITAYPLTLWFQWNLTGTPCYPGELINTMGWSVQLRWDLLVGSPGESLV